jgi:hypothetical protein
MIGNGLSPRPEPKRGENVIVIRRWGRGPGKQNREFGGRYVGRRGRFTTVTTPQGGGQRWTSFKWQPVTQGSLGRQVSFSRFRHVVIPEADEGRVSKRVPKRVPRRAGAPRRFGI